MRAVIRVILYHLKWFIFNFYSIFFDVDPLTRRNSSSFFFWSTCDHNLSDKKRIRRVPACSRKYVFWKFWLDITLAVIGFISINIVSRTIVTFAGANAYSLLKNFLNLSMDIMICMFSFISRSFHLEYRHIRKNHGHWYSKYSICRPIIR